MVKVGQEEKAAVVEQRVKATVIRRRKKIEPEIPPVVEGQAPQTTQPAAGAVAAAGAVVHPGADAVKDKASPETQKEAGQEKADAGKVGGIEKKGTIQLTKEMTDEFVAKFKKAASRRKSRAELEEEDIKKSGGLMHYAEVLREDTSATDRVYSPIRSKKKKTRVRSDGKTVVTERKATKKIIKVKNAISVAELSQDMGVKSSEIIKKLMELEIMATVNQFINVETASAIATKYGFTVEAVALDEGQLLGIDKKAEEKEVRKVRPENLVLRPPVVTVMGHVDHGKTSILDAIRKSDVVSGEAGGITQHIGAYEVHVPKGTITFIDTPGHSAFTSMRARGAQVTDIVVLVVAADDGVMPQTIEAIDHAKAAGVPIIIAINKIDKPQATPDRVKQSLTEYGLLTEEWGGDVICVGTSAKTKQGIDSLLEMILLQAEVMELKSEKEEKLEAVVIEAHLDKGRGPMASVLIRKGVLKNGDYVVCGLHCGKIKAMADYLGKPITEGGPSKPVEILGLSGIPEAGDKLYVVTDDKAAKVVSEMRQQKDRSDKLGKSARVTLEELHSQMLAGEIKELNLILKTDVSGSIEAIVNALGSIKSTEVVVKVLHTGVGGINENDVMLASASNAVVVGFNVSADMSAVNLSKSEQVEMKSYSIIYELVDDVKKALEGLLSPEFIEKVQGHAEVRELFKVPKIGTIAGCGVKDGVITRKSKVRLFRDNTKIFEGGLSSLRRFKDDAKEVREGFECGIGIENYNDLKVGDVIEAYEIEKKTRTLG